MTQIDPERLDRARRKGIWISVLGILLVVGAGTALQRSGVGNFREIWEKADGGLLLASWLLVSLAFLFMALRWRSLMPRGHTPPAGELSALICAGLLLNYAAPGPLGEVGAAWFAHRRHKVPMADALASGVAARLVGLISAAIAGFFVWLLADLPVPEDFSPAVNTAAFIAALLGFGLAALVMMPNLWNRLYGALSAALPRNTYTAPVIDRGGEALASLTDAISRVTRRGTGAYAWAVLWSLCAHGAVIGGILLAAESLAAPYSLSGVVFTYTVTTAGAVLLFALPGSYVGWDALFFGLMVSSAGIPVQESAAIAAIIRVQQLGYMLLGGLSLGWLLRMDD